MPLKASVVFSSVAGRFGNGGQADYSAANDLLCKITSSFRTSRPETRGIAIDWSAWGGIGMATRGSIPKMMELAGIDMLPPEAGIPIVRRELTTGGTRGEVLIAQRLGVLLNEWEESGGIDQEAKVVAQAPMIGRIAKASVFNAITVETTLDPALQPFLHDHQIDGTPVLPGVMGLEAFAEGAHCLAPGWQVEAIDDVEFLAPFKFYRNEPRTVTTKVVVTPSGTSLLANCKLIGSRVLANQAEPQLTTHFTGQVRLTKQMAAGAPALKLGTPSGSLIEAGEIYGLYFHGPAYQVLERAWWDGERVIGLMATGLRNNHHPADLQSLIDPRLVELCFQTAGLWEMGVRGRMGLPRHLDRVSLFLPEQELKDARLYAIVTPDASGESFKADVVDKDGKRYVHLDGYRTVAIPDALPIERLKALQKRMSAEAAVAA